MVMVLTFHLGEFASGSISRVKWRANLQAWVNGYFEVKIQRNLRAVDEIDMIVWRVQ
jgi:hypothetical protein